MESQIFNCCFCNILQLFKSLDFVASSLTCDGCNPDGVHISSASTAAYHCGLTFGLPISLFNQQVLVP